MLHTSCVMTASLHLQCFFCAEWHSNSAGEPLRLHCCLPQADHGGMQAYVQWINPGINSTVQEFYQNPTIQVSTASVLRQCMPRPYNAVFNQNPTILVSCLHG